MPFGNLMNCGCCTGSGGGGDTVTISGCAACPMPRVLTMTWYYNGNPQNPCTTPGGISTITVQGPITTSLTYDPVIGNWRTPWLPTPCWSFGNNNFLNAPVAPFGCLYYRMIWACQSLTLFLDVAHDAVGGQMNSCFGPVPSQSPALSPPGQNSSNLCPILVTYVGDVPASGRLFNHGALSP